MRYWGKVIGLVLGLLSGTGFWGLAFGLLIGHLIDKARAVQGRAILPINRPGRRCFSAPLFR